MTYRILWLEEIHRALCTLPVAVCGDPAQRSIESGYVLESLRRSWTILITPRRVLCISAALRRNPPGRVSAHCRQAALAANLCISPLHLVCVLPSRRAG